MHFLALGPHPVAQRDSRPAILVEAVLPCPLLDVCLCPKMFFRGQESGGRDVRVDQLDNPFAPVRSLRLGPAVKSRSKQGLPARPPLDMVKSRLHGRTSTTELREP